MKATLSLFEARSLKNENKFILRFLTLLKRTSKSGNTIVQNSYDVIVNLLNKQGDASICFKYEIANFGLQSLPSRPHRFWFTTPQTDIKICAYTDMDLPLDVETIESSPSCTEIRIHFPTALAPADQLKYRLQYQVKEGFLGPSYYDVTARTLTRNTSFTILSPENLRFDMKRIVLESADGFISDLAPILLLSQEGLQEKLSWHYRNPKIGDQFRTYWSLI